MATVRLTRFPRSLARSAFTRVSMAFRVNSPSLPKGISRIRKYRTASLEYRLHSTTGSTTLPTDLPIFFPSITSHPWPKTCLGSGSPRACSMIGQ